MLTRMRAREQFQKFCEHEQASTRVILRATRAKAKFCEHFLIEWDHSIPLTCKTKTKHELVTHAYVFPRFLVGVLIGSLGYFLLIGRFDNCGFALSMMSLNKTQ